MTRRPPTRRRLPRRVPRARGDDPTPQLVQPPPWLVAVDLLQRAFADPGSPWFTPGVGSIAGVVADLVPRFGARVVFTRFVPPREIEGSWRSYYERWRFAAGTHDSDLWSVIEPWDRAVSISSHTFSKWVPELRALVGPHPSIVLCGVSTDCCVLATAFAAVDGGADVRVVAAACAAKTPELHEAALQMMRGRAPQLTVVTSRRERAWVSDRNGGNGEI